MTAKAPGPSRRRTARPRLSLRAAAREFARHPSPWMIGVVLVAALAARLAVGGWRAWDAVVPLALVLALPLVEWSIHVFVLHWRPRSIFGLTLDSQLARKHREHHSAPRELPLIFIPWQSLAVIGVVVVAVSLLAFPRLGLGVGLGLTFLAATSALALAYEWTHYLIHTDYRPRHAPYHRVWRHHRNHHFKNEHYWFTVTSVGTADRLLRTGPDPASVQTSPTARRLHAGES